MACSNANRRKILSRVSMFNRCIGKLCLWDRAFCCFLGKSIGYRHLTHPTMPTALPSFSAAINNGIDCRSCEGLCSHGCNRDSDLVALKISLLGDSQIGKSSFVAPKNVTFHESQNLEAPPFFPGSKVWTPIEMKYGGNEKDRGSLQMAGLNLMDKTQIVKGARISYSIWEVEGDEKSLDHIQMACKDSVAILFMFDLTSRCTLNSVITWYQQARKWNKTAIPVLIGAKFDDFIQLPLDLQWTISSQARALAKALDATLFFSSATYNINVSKIFKFVTAKLFNIPWTVERNLTIGEPIIDF